MLKELIEEGKKAGLFINTEKTKILTKEIPEASKTKIKIGKDDIEIVDNTIYLGQTISFENSTEKEIHRRINLAWRKFWSLRKIIKGSFSLKQKSAIFNSCVVPVVTYGAQVWAPTKRLWKKIETTQNNMERAILNIKRKDKVRVSKIKNLLKTNLEMVKWAKKKKWDWAGHISRKRGKNEMERRLLEVSCSPNVSPNRAGKARMGQAG